MMLIPPPAKTLYWFCSHLSKEHMPAASQLRGVMVGQALCSYTAHVAVCSLAPNKK